MSTHPISGQEAFYLTPCLSVVIAVYNEIATIAHILEAVLRQPQVQEVIITDDGSSDGTWEALLSARATDARIRLHRNVRNIGKGAALRKAFVSATAPIVIVQDADLEYDPRDYPLMVRPILEDKADVVFGTRFVGMGAHRVLYFWHYVGNRILTILSNMLSNINLTDIEAGYKAFRREIIQSIQIREDRFGCEPEIVARVARIKGVRIYEVPIHYHGRTYSEGKKVDWRDGVSALRCILKYNFGHNRMELIGGCMRVKERRSNCFRRVRKVLS